MTEVPEHLLRRSKERRAALGLGGGDDAGTPPASPGEEPGTGSTATGEPSVPAAPEKVAPAPAAAAAAAAPEPPRPLPAYVAAAVARPKIPWWALPVLAGLPLWALIYVGVLAQPEEGIADPVLTEGRELYAASCAPCHGGGGEGGTGRPLDEVVLTFPDPADHIAWIEEGSPAAGTPYGDPNRPGGQRISQDGWGAMPGFGGTLTEEEIVAITRYEREVIGGEEGGELAAGDEGDEGGSDPESEAESEGGDTGSDTGSGVEEGGRQSTSGEGGDTSGSGGENQGAEGQQQGSGG